jgi:hypothetical protein
MTGASFDSTKTALQELLSRVDSGKLQLPDFQRGWVWDDDRIKSLLASVSVSFPIGAVMLLETGGQHVRFKPRPVTGTKDVLRTVTPETLILDGQQRLTSLYQALMSTLVVETKDTKGKRINRWYYIDMKKATASDDDREDAVLSVPEDRQAKAFGGEMKLDLTSADREYATDLFPANRIFQSAEWRQAYNKHWNYAAEKIQLYDQFEIEVIKRFEQYQVPVIELKKETPKEAVCLIFERVNTGGVALNVFELLTASFAADNFQLRDDWAAREQRLKSQHPVLRNLQNDDFLQAMSLLATQARRREAIGAGLATDKAPGISCKRRDILKLEVADWRRWADQVEAGFSHAARFLYGQKIFKARDLPYRTQLVPLAAMHVDLGKDGESQGAKLKMARWYWCGVLGELYGGAIESRFARDLPEVTAMVRGETVEPITIQDSSFQANRLLSLRTRNSSAYKGVYALLMRDGGRDFRTGEAIEAQTFFDDKVDIHHIFPEKWCKDSKIESAVFNSVINKTAIAARTNRQIGGRAPSKYLPAMERKAGIDDGAMDDILRSHCIDPAELRADRFWEFFAARAEALLQRIEAATGKTISREPTLFQPGAVMEAYDEGPEDWEEEEPLEGVVEDDEEPASTDGDSTPAQTLRFNYWTAFRSYLHDNQSPLRPQKPSRAHWYSFGIGTIRAHTTALIITRDDKIAVELTMTSADAKTLFQKLLTMKDEIEATIGAPLDWREMPAKRASRIVLFKPVDPYDEKTWPQQFEWLRSNLEAFDKTFRPLCSSKTGI